MNEENVASSKMTYEQLERYALAYESLAQDRARYIELLHNKLDKMLQRQAYSDWLAKSMRDEFEVWLEFHKNDYRERVLP